MTEAVPVDAPVRNTASPTDVAVAPEAPVADSALTADVLGTSLESTRDSLSPCGPPVADAANESWTASASPTQMGSEPPRAARVASGEPWSGPVSAGESDVHAVQAPFARARTCVSSPPTTAPSGQVTPTLWNSPVWTTGVTTRPPATAPATIAPLIAGASGARC